MSIFLKRLLVDAITSMPSFLVLTVGTKCLTGFGAIVSVMISLGLLTINNAGRSYLEKTNHDR